jgi:hypothetical protein
MSRRSSHSSISAISLVMKKQTAVVPGVRLAALIKR